MSGIRGALNDMAPALPADDENTLEEDGAFIEGGESDEYEEAAPDSVLAELRAKVKEVAHVQTVDLELPWFDGLLVGRYKAIPINRVVRAPRPGYLPGADPNIAADALAMACVDLLRSNRDGSEGVESLDPDGGITRYDETLVDLLGLPPTARTARAVMFSLYAASSRADALIIQHFGQYMEWLSGTGQEVSELAVGESRAR